MITTQQSALYYADVRCQCALVQVTGHIHIQWRIDHTSVALLVQHTHRLHTEHAASAFLAFSSAEMVVITDNTTFRAVCCESLSSTTLAAWYTGLVPQLQDDDIIANAQQRQSVAGMLQTVGMRTIHLRLNCLMQVNMTCA